MSQCFPPKNTTQDFPSLGEVVLPWENCLVCIVFLTLAGVEKRWIQAFPKNIIRFWNSNSHFQDFEPGSALPFLYDDYCYAMALAHSLISLSNPSLCHFSLSLPLFTFLLSLSPSSASISLSLPIVSPLSLLISLYSFSLPFPCLPFSFPPVSPASVFLFSPSLFPTYLSYLTPSLSPFSRSSLSCCPFSPSVLSLSPLFPSFSFSLSVLSLSLSPLSPSLTSYFLLISPTFSPSSISLFSFFPFYLSPFPPLFPFSLSLFLSLPSHFF